MDDIFTELVANGIWILMGGLVTLIVRAITLVPSVRQRIRLLRFLGIGKHGAELRVYLSTLYIPRGGSVDSRGTARSYQGPAIPGYELDVIQPLSDLLRYESLRNLPAFARRWLGKVHWAFEETHLVFSSSPADATQIERTNTLVVGSQYYNTAGELYTETCDPILKMEQEGTRMVIRVTKGPRKGEVFQQMPREANDLAIVERLVDDTHGTTIFLAAGLGVVGTRGAVQYLIDNWDKLAQSFATERFALCLRFRNIDKDPDAYRKPIELAEFR